jgi:mevalonate kinase
MKILSVLGHKTLDEKLLYHDIKRKRSKSARFVRNLMSKSLTVVETPGFGQEDLEKLSMEQLQALQKSFVNKLAEKRREHKEVLEIKAGETERMVKFMEEIQNIELAAKTTLRPCVNVLPGSVDMARVLLLN